MGRASKIDRGLLLLVGFILLCTAVTVACVILMPYLIPSEKHCDDHDVIRHEDHLELFSPSGASLKIHLNTKRTSKKFGKYYYCAESKKEVAQPAGNVTCKEYEWRLQNFVGSVTDCFDLGSQSWYGGSLLWKQNWPINGAEHEEAPYVPGDIYQMQYGGVMERFWISSGGFAIFVKDSVPLLLEMRKGQLCLTGSQESGNAYNLAARNASDSLLAYTVCRGPDIKSLYRGLRLWDPPQQLPERDLFTDPIWSTWAYLKQNISSQSVLDFAQNISAHNLSCSQVEIDDKWSVNYGDHQFDRDRFPDPEDLFSSIHSLGYNVTLWVHPFVNTDSEEFAIGRARMQAGEPFFVASRQNRSQPAFTSWWRGTNSTLIDVTDPSGNASQSFRRQLQNLQKLGIDSFKFDGGETNWIPKQAALLADRVNPGWYTSAWSEFSYSADTDKRRQETRVGFRAQHLPILVRTMDKDSHWGLDNGLKAVVTSALTHCLLGYNFYLPDMIGGNAYCNDTGLEGRCYPDKELYIRWLQAAAFMPSLQFSIPPWVYGDDVVAMTRSLLAVRHEQRFGANLNRALEDAKRGVPVVRPLWWATGTNFEVSDQFLLGDRILVAPVLTEGQTLRGVNFPSGTWRPWLAKDSSDDIVGPKDAVVVPVTLSSVPAFYLIDY